MFDVAVNISVRKQAQEVHRTTVLEAVTDQPAPGAAFVEPARFDGFTERGVVYQFTARALPTLQRTFGEVWRLMIDLNAGSILATARAVVPVMLTTVGAWAAMVQVMSSEPVPALPDQPAI
jgi:NAD(P)-dependent dehydrogenase (short-subunit alcohol dehydrogenase family)